MKKPLLCLLLLGCVGTAGCIISPSIPAWPGPPAGELALAADQQLIVAATVNQLPVRLRVDTAYSGIVLNPGVARRAGLTPSGFKNDIRIGKIRLDGETGVGSLGIGMATARRRFVWFRQDITTGADGVINIAALPHDKVTLRLASPMPGERTMHLQTDPNGFWTVSHGLQSAGENITTWFSLESPRTLLTAAGAAHAAEHHAGTWTGEPIRHLVALGVVRPARPMTFRRPLSVGPLNIDRVLVRTSDFKGNHSLPADPEADPNEIVVTGRGKATRSRLGLIVGQDYLSRCSSITYRKADRILTLSCRG
jgi:hypothetical protein